MSYCIFWLAFIFPPDTYRYYMDEPDHMFLDLTAALFYTLCVIAFLLPVGLVDVFCPVDTIQDRPLRTSIAPTRFILVPLIGGTILTLLSSVLLVRTNPTILSQLMTQGGSDIKADLDLRAPLALSSFYLLGIIWWATWRSDQLKLRGKQARLVKIALYIAIASVILSTILKVARNELIPVITGIVTIFVLRKSARRELTRGFVMRVSIVFLISVPAIFFAFSFIRGTSEWDTMITELMGYTIASYNRLSALLDGRLHYPAAGRGFYLCVVLGTNKMLNVISPFKDNLGRPDSLEAWESEFQAIWQAGLNGNFIWSGAFGYVFAEVGWLTPIYLAMQGLLCGLLWRGVKVGSALGIAMYPLCVFCILFWIGTNYMFGILTLVLFIEGLALTGYEWVFTDRGTQQNGSLGRSQSAAAGSQQSRVAAPKAYEC